MEYEEWLKTIELLKGKSLNKEHLEKIKNAPLNENINNLLVPKLEDLIYYKFTQSKNKIIKELSLMFSDRNYLDFNIINYKKEIKFILELLSIKQIPLEKQNEIKNSLKESSDKIYDILIEEANKEDYTGVLASTIKNSQIKWSD